MMSPKGVQNTIPVLVAEEAPNVDASEDSPEKAAKPASSPAPKIAAAVLAILVGSLAWHVATDLMAPSSSTGSVTAFTALVAPRVAGQVSAVQVADNQPVRAGEQLFQLDPAPFDLAVRQAEANLAQVLQSLDASVVSLTSAEAKVEQAQSSLDSTQSATERTLMLFERGVASQSEVDAANLQLANARSVLEASTADLESARMKAGTDGAPNPQVMLAQVQLEQAQLNRAFTSVDAPADGVVTNLKLAVGQFVNAGSPALTFIEASGPWVIVDMRENQLANIDVGDPASVLFDGVPGRSFEGRVRSVAWGIDPGRTAANGLPQNQSMARWFEPARTIPVHIELLDNQDWPENVRVGSKASAVVFAEGKENPVAGLSGMLQAVSSYMSYLY